MTSSRRRITVLLLFSLLSLFSVYHAFFNPPANFPTEFTVEIPEGETLASVAAILKNENVIRSPQAMKALAVLSGSDEAVQAGDYYFHGPVSLFTVTKMVTTGNYGLQPIRITIPEGTEAAHIANFFDERFVRFEATEFYELIIGKEGYLFPDTYLFLPNVKAKEVVRVMEENFHAHITEIQPEIDAFGRPLEEIVIMASLLEKEARKFKTRQTIAGILWNRITIDMPLQVDAVFPYIIGKNTFEVTYEDLKVDSPYNTYKYPGLPIGPIANPGLDSLLAAVTPNENDYLFYLTGHDGYMYYARTFEEHKQNKFLHLR